jgi:hypothetical protein
MIMLVAGLVFAQPGVIQIAADQGVTTCDVTDVAGLVTVYVFHINTIGSTASQFKILPSAGVTMTHLADNSAFLTIGNSQTGIAIAYQACFTGPLEILSMSYLGSGTSVACSDLTVVEDPTANPPGLFVTDCASPPNKLIGLGSTAIINDDGGCPCPDIVPVEETSWGQIKAIYRQ